jgi:hypothetical protein
MGSIGLLEFWSVDFPSILFFGFTHSIVLLEFQLVDFLSIYLLGLHVQFVHWNFSDWYNNWWNCVLCLKAQDLI